MTNPFSDPPIVARRNPFSDTPQANPFSDAPVERRVTFSDDISSGIRSSYNFVKNVARLGVTLMSPATSMDEVRKLSEGVAGLPRRFGGAVVDARNQVIETTSQVIDAGIIAGQNLTGNRNAIIDSSTYMERHPQVAALGAMFSRDGMSSVANSLPSMPAMMVDMLVNKTAEAATGLKFTEDTTRVLTPDEGRAAARTTLGNITAMVAAGPIKNATMRALENYAVSDIVSTLGAAEGRTLGTLVQAGRQEIKLSPFMRNVIAETVTGGGAGIAQGAVMDANQEQFYQSAIAGVMFAPLGTVLSMFNFDRDGVTIARHGPGAPEQLRANVNEVAALQMLKVTDKMSLAEIAAMPDAIVTAPDLLAAVADNVIKVDPAGAGIFRRVSESSLENLQKIIPKDRIAINENPRVYADDPRSFSVLYLGEKAFEGNRDLVSRHFKRVGNLPDDIKQVASYEGVDYYVTRTAEQTRQAIDVAELVENRKSPEYGPKEDPLITITSIDLKSTKRVRASELRDIRDSVVQLNRTAFYDEHYEKFAVGHDPKLPLAPQIAQYVMENNLGSKANVIAREFGIRYDNLLDNLTETSQQERARMDALVQEVTATANPKFNSLSQSLRKKAISNNMWIDESNGGYDIRDIDSGDIISTERTASAAMRAIDAYGQSTKALGDMGESLIINRNGIPTSDQLGFSSEQMDRLREPFEDVEKANAAVEGKEWTNFSSRLGAWVDRFDAAHPALTSFEANVTAIDNMYGTHFRGAYYFETQQAAREMKLTVKEIRESPRYKAIENLSARIMKQPDGEALMEHVTNWIETHSDAEMRAFGGLFTGYEPAKYAKIISNADKLATLATNLGVDIHNVLRWNRQRRYIETQYVGRYRKLALEKTDIWMQSVENSPEYQLNRDALAKDMLIRIEFESAKYLQDPNYHAELQQLDAEANIASGNSLGDYQTVADAISTIEGGQEGANTLYAATRLWSVMRNPELNLTRAEYAAKYKMTPEMLKLGEFTNDMYAELGDKFGVNSDRRMVGYLNHLRNWGDPLDPTFAQSVADGMDDAGMRRFVSDMLRTGETVNYVKNPIHALDAYIRTGAKVPLMQTLDKWDKATAIELKRISNKDVQSQVAQRLFDYEDALLGRPELTEKAARGIAQRFFEKLGLEKGVVDKLVLAQDVAKRMESKSSGMDTTINLTSASLLGARPVMALRDLVDATSKFFILHGAERTSKVISIFTDKITPQTYEALIRSGAIIDAEFRDVYNPATAPVKPGPINAFSQQAADLAFRSSFQPQTFKRLQAAIYLETRKLAISLINDVVVGKITKQQAYDKLYMNSWDKATRNAFDNLVGNGSVDQAAHMLGVNESQRIAGVTGMGNAPQGAGTSVGRVFNQLGSWTIANRSIYMRMFSRGTASEVRGAVVRYGISQGAIALAGATFGFNMSRWFMTPMSFMFTGGPLIDAAKTAAAVATAYSGGGEAQKNYAINQLKQAALLPVPFGYAARGMYRGAQLGLNGENFGIARPAWAALGGTPNEENRSLMNLLSGNYPIKPEDGTNLNTALFRYMTPD